ncbi:MAG: YicC family protein [Bacteroidetes bacterium RIFCSPLOWO2_12_FULL_35_15]|nr:MAG: YicC family protein [Bacteroidetes bacterium RIFCSPLOWO2_12_FULL_35_15]
MIKSMTGFGKAVLEIPGKKITVEVRSLNSKQLDLNLRMPYVYKEKELELRSDISKQIERGKVDLSVYTESTQEILPVAINKTLVKTYYKELKSLSEELNEENQNLMALILKMPDVLKAEREVVELDEEEWNQVKLVVNKAIEAFQKFRSDEGKTLAIEFNSRIGIIYELLAEVMSNDAIRVETIRTRIKNNIAELVEKEKIDENRFEQELIYYIEKLDITEEKLRLKTHLDYFIKTMQEPGCGRKLGFISQEIGREINTIGSKANDATIQKMVVQMKDELEKIKEQMLNVL